MNHETKIPLRVFLIILIGTIVVVCAASLNQPIKVQRVVIPINDPNYVQCPSEAQERLKAQGFYHGKIDGKWGRESDRAYCDWAATQEFKRVEK